MYFFSEPYLTVGETEESYEVYEQINGYLISL